MLACNVATIAHSQNYPTKPVRVLVGLGAGGGTDLMARIVTPKLAEAMGQPFVVENRVGAGGVIAGDVVAKAPKDGYTLLINSTSQASSAAQYTKLPYDPVRDFAPVSLLSESPYVFALSNTVNARSVKELVALAKASLNCINEGAKGHHCSLRRSRIVL